MKNQDFQRVLNIGIMGSRGIPNHYGGYEQFAQYLSKGLVGRGHRVSVYQSSLHPYRSDQWEGVHLIRRFDPEDRLGPFGQFVYDFEALRDARRRDFDLLLQLGYTSSVIFFPLWPRDMIHVIHLDGQEWKRAKYSPPVRSFLRRMEALAVSRGDLLIADSLAIQSYIRREYQKNAVYISYGAGIPPDFRPGTLDAFSLKEGRYFLAIARFVPENNLHFIVEGYLDSGHAFPLVLVGHPATKYGRRLQRQFDNPSIRWAGSLYDQEKLNDLRRFAGLYFHGHSVGGANPSLLEAMACRSVICAHDNPFNRAELGDRAFYFRSAREVCEIINSYDRHPGLEKWKEGNFLKIVENHRWDRIVEQYEACFFQALGFRDGLLC